MGPHDERQADQWALLDELSKEFAGRWGITRSDFPDGRMFAAKPLLADWQSSWVIRRDAGDLHTGILRREAGLGVIPGQVTAPAA
jgi:hypothetical protein